MDDDACLTIKLIQNRVLDKFSQTFRDTTKHSYYNALMSQDLKLETFKADIMRFDHRMKGF